MSKRDFNGNLVAAARFRAGLSQRELAQTAGVSHSSVARLERGAGVRPSTLARICRVLNLDPPEVARVQEAAESAAPGPEAARAALEDAIRSASRARPAQPTTGTRVRLTPQFHRARLYYAEHQKELAERYGAVYLALRESEVVDSDAQLGPLVARVFQRFQEGDVFIAHTKAPKVFRVPSPRLVTSR